MDKKQIIKKQVQKYAITTLGCVLYSLGVSLFLDAGGLASGGATGIAIIIHHLLELAGITWIDTGIIVLIINIPLLILGLVYFGKQFLVSTVYSTVLSSLLMVFWKWLMNTVYHLPITDNYLISAVFGGAIFGLGAGLIFRMGGSTGGTDIPVKILRKKFRHIKTGMISMTSDIIIVTLSFIVFHDLEVLFYTIVSVVVFTFIFDWVLYGGNSAKMVFIISEGEKAEKICARVLTEVNTGATFIDAQGAYSRQNKRILLCVIKPFLFPKLRDVVHEEDKKAFMIVSSAKEIYGEGYQDPNADVI